MLKREQKNITGDALRLFLEMAGDDMEHIANELEKLLCFTYGKDAIETQDVALLYQNQPARSKKRQSLRLVDNLPC